MWLPWDQGHGCIQNHVIAMGPVVWMGCIVHPMIVMGLGTWLHSESCDCLQLKAWIHSYTLWLAWDQWHGSIVHHVVAMGPVAWKHSAPCGCHATKGMDAMCTLWITDMGLGTWDWGHSEQDSSVWHIWNLILYLTNLYKLQTGYILVMGVLGSMASSIISLLKQLMINNNHFLVYNVKSM